MNSAISILSAISFDPEIRGILVVLVGVVVLIGSVFAIISTNTGMRLGLLITCAGFFGWMTLLTLVWWMYGIGLVGRAPAWMTQELNYDRESALATEEGRDLPPPDQLVTADEAIAEYPLIEAVGKGQEGEDWEPTTATDLVTLATPLVVVQPSALTDDFIDSIMTNADTVISDNPDVGELLAGDRDALAAAINDDAAALRDDLNDPLGDWCLLAASDPRRGEAVTTSDAALAEQAAFGDSTSTSSYIVYDVYLKGGKEDCSPVAEQSTLEQAGHRIGTTFQFKNPPQYAAVTQQKVVPVEVEVGQAPPAPEADETASVVTTVMQRNLGNERFIPFVFMLANLALFAVFVLMLNHRDRVVDDAREAFEASK